MCKTPRNKWVRSPKTYGGKPAGLACDPGSNPGQGVFMFDALDLIHTTLRKCIIRRGCVTRVHEP